MKKHLSKILLAAFAVMLLSMTVLVGCGGGSAESLEGTKWSITKLSASGVEMDVAQFAQRLGVSADQLAIEFKDGKAIGFTGEPTDYTYENGKLVIAGREVQLNGNTMSVEVDGLSMTLQKQ